MTEKKTPSTPVTKDANDVKTLTPSPTPATPTPVTPNPTSVTPLTSSTPEQEASNKAIDDNILRTDITEKQAETLAMQKDSGIDPTRPVSETVALAQSRLENARRELAAAELNVEVAEELSFDEEETQEEITSRLEELGSPQPYFVYDRDTKIPASIIGPGSNDLAGSVDLTVMVNGEIRTFQNVREDPSGIDAGTFHLRDRKEVVRAGKKVEVERIVPSGGIFTPKSLTETNETIPRPVPPPSHPSQPSRA